MAMPLEDYLLGAYEAPEEIPETEEEQAPLRERFRITDDGQANWAIRKIAQARAQFAEAQCLAGQEMDRVSRWLTEQKRDMERTEAFFTALLREYSFPRFASDPRLKTIKLPAGKVQVRQQPPEYRRDNQALLNWLKERGMTEFVEVAETPRWAELKRQVQVAAGHVVTADGEIVEGVEVIERSPAFKVVTVVTEEGA